jgi:hypothetical protein
MHSFFYNLFELNSKFCVCSFYDANEAHQIRNSSMYFLYTILSITEALAESEALITDLESLSKEVPDVKRHAGNFEPAETVKSVPLDPSSDASKQNRIGSELDPK